MPRSQLDVFVQHLRRSVTQDGAGMTDGQLLDCFLGRRDDSAFAALVRRHGAMVWGVCRRLLRNHHDAEDAFQATFLILVRKAASVCPREMVGNWLYGVAHQTALNARATTARRRTRERQVAEVPESLPERLDPWHDLQPLLDQELSRLPAKYRAVILLCDLSGKTRKEAAGQLGCPEGTVAGRLTRGRMMLAKRFTRYGLALSGGSLAAVLAQNVVAAGVPSSVASSTIRAATQFTAGQAAGTGVISVEVAALTQGVLRTMQMTKLKLATAIAFAAGVLLAGVFAPLNRPVRADEEPPEQPTRKTEAKPTDPLAGIRFSAIKTTGPGKMLVEREDGITLTNPDGSRPVPIAAPAGTEAAFPRLSPDHRRVAFIIRDMESRSRPIDQQGEYVADRILVRDRLDKEPDVDLPLAGMAIGLAWSPDGSRLVTSELLGAKTGQGEAEFETWLIDPQVKSKTRLPLPKTVCVQDWSDNGKTFLAVRLTSGRARPELLLVSVDGKAVTKLTDLGAFEPLARLSPDGSKVLFPDADPDEKPGPDERRARLHLYLLDTNTKTRTRVPGLPKNAFVRGCAWSPRGERLAFTWAEVHSGLNKKVLDAGAIEVDTKSHLVVCDADGKNPKTIAVEKSLYAFGRALGWLDWR